MSADEYADKMTKYYGPAWMGLDEEEDGWDRWEIEPSRDDWDEEE